MVDLIVPADLLEESKVRLNNLGLEGERTVRVWSYPDLAKGTSFPAGTYLFTSVSVLTPSQKSLAIVAEKALLAGGPGFRVLNLPSQAAPRLSLMAAFREGGLEVAETWTVRQMPSCVKYPLVLRSESQRGVAESPVLCDEGELREALGTMVLGGYALEDLYGLHVAQQEGVFDRAPAVWLLRIGDRVVSSDPAGLLLAACGAHALADPDSPWMRALNRAGLDFVKLSFIPVEDRLALWRIEDGPLALPDRVENPSASSARISEQVSAAFRSLLTPSQGGAVVAVQFTPETVLAAMRDHGGPP